MHSAEPNSARIPIYQPNIITQEAVDAITANVYYNDDTYTWTPRKYLQGEKDINYDRDIEHFCALVVHPETGETITSYKKLANDPRMNKIWMTGFGKQFGNLVQGGDKTGTPELNALHVACYEFGRNKKHSQGSHYHMRAHSRGF